MPKVAEVVVVDLVWHVRGNGGVSPSSAANSEAALQESEARGIASHQVNRPAPGSRQQKPDA